MSDDRNVTSLVHTSVDDCRMSLERCNDPALLNAVIAYLDKNEMDHKTRRSLIQRRLKQIARENSNEE